MQTSIAKTWPHMDRKYSRLTVIMRYIIIKARGESAVCVRERGLLWDLRMRICAPEHFNVHYISSEVTFLGFNGRISIYFLRFVRKQHVEIRLSVDL